MIPFLHFILEWWLPPYLGCVVMCSDTGRTGGKLTPLWEVGLLFFWWPVACAIGVYKMIRSTRRDG